MWVGDLVNYILFYVMDFWVRVVVVIECICVCEFLEVGMVVEGNGVGRGMGCVVRERGCG